MCMLMLMLPVNASCNSHRFVLGCDSPWTICEIRRRRPRCSYGLSELPNSHPVCVNFRYFLISLGRTLPCSLFKGGRMLRIVLCEFGNCILYFVLNRHVLFFIGV